MWFWLLVVFALGIGGCVSVVSLAGVVVNHAAHQQHTVVYSVTGTGATTDITYDTLQEGSGQNGLAQVSNAPLPWTKTIVVSGLFTVLDVTGTVSANGGSVTCKVTEDGQVLTTNTATGAYASANCSTAGR